MRFVPRFRRGRAAQPRRPGQRQTGVQDEAAGAPPVVEEEAAPPPPPPRPLIWPWLLVLLLLVAGGLVALWLVTRDNDHKRGATVTVPRVIGEQQAAAVDRLNRAGLKSKILSGTSTAAEGTVFAEDPHAGSTVARGSKVRLNLSNGRSTGGVPPPPPPPPPPPAATRVAVPDVTGQAQEAAQRRLNVAGLKSGVVYVPSDQPQGTVVSQSPSGGTTVKRGSRVQLNASLGPNPGTQKTVPNVVGMSPQQASSRLSSAGFNVQRLTRKVSVRSQDGFVVDEQPAGGRKAPAGSTVTIYVGKF